MGSRSPGKINAQTLRIGAIAFAFLTTTVALVLVQPKDSGQKDAQVVTETAPQAPLEVSRAETTFSTAETLPDKAERKEVTVDIQQDPSSEQPDLSKSEPVTGQVTNLSYTSASTSTSVQNLFSTKQGQLESLVIEALRQGQTNDYIDALVNHAVSKGTVDVPGALLTPDGRVDTPTLLTILSSTPEAMRAGAELYTVQPGDSLASISYRFFGETSRAGEIYALNQDTLIDTGSIIVGQELIIPPN